MGSDNDRPLEVALYGGSFNPPHMGHVFVMAQVLATEPVDELWLLPTHTHAFGKELAPFCARMEMCLKVADLFGARVRVSRVEEEIASEGCASFTIDTLTHLGARHPDHRFSWVIGSDNVGEIDRWKEADLIRRMTRFIVVNREGYPVEGAGPPIPDVSSTWIRGELGSGRSVRGFVPHQVARICEEGGYYRPS